MEDLLECPVCMDRYAPVDDKLPRLFMCGHTFCQSCIKSLVKERSVTCPTCRHKHKCNDVENLPRNLTLLQLIEFLEPKGTPRHCDKCLKNVEFCEKCAKPSEKTICRSCLKKELWGLVSALQGILAQGILRVGLPVLNHPNLAESILDSEHGWSEPELCNALIQRVDGNYEQEKVLREEAISRFLAFHREAFVQINAVSIDIRSDAITCNTGIALTALLNKCAIHLHRLDDTIYTVVRRERDIRDISERVNIHQRKQNLVKKCENRVWNELKKTTAEYVDCMRLLTALLSICIILSFLYDSLCPNEQIGFFCLISMVLSSRIFLVIIAFAFSLKLLKYPNEDFDSASVPPHILSLIREETNVKMKPFPPPPVIDVDVQFKFAPTSNANNQVDVRHRRPPTAKLSEAQRRKMRNAR